MTAYEILGVDPDTPIEEIEKIYKKLCKIYHPDQGLQTSTEKLKEINEAWDLIKSGKATVKSETDIHENAKKSEEPCYEYRTYTKEQTTYDNRNEKSKKRMKVPFFVRWWGNLIGGSFIIIISAILKLIQIYCVGSLIFVGIISIANKNLSWLIDFKVQIDILIPIFMFVFPILYLPFYSWLQKK